MQKRGIDTGCFNYYDASSMFHGSLMNIMGTKFDIVILDKKESESETIWYGIVSELRRLDRMLNRFDAASEVSHVNREAFAKPIRVTPEMFAVLQHCKRYYMQTLGLFDITLKDFSKVALSEATRSVAFSHADISLDFGGFAKGYAMKKIKKLLLNAGVGCCFVDFGDSSLLGIGHHPYGDSWKVSVENPFNKQQILNEILLRDEALSVSGNTPAYTAHIVRPDSGQSMRQHRLVCIKTADPLDAEVLTTAFMVAHSDEKERIIENFEIRERFEYNLSSPVR